ncbi:hypothetical protein [Streptomyces sp. NPDC002164]|uniref:hypothetical protein n=1 Tax=Streptomyces sp. NPDC002164 TaxID=3364633 RepID=UPI0036CECA99
MGDPDRHGIAQRQEQPVDHAALGADIEEVRGVLHGPVQAAVPGGLGHPGEVEIDFGRPGVGGTEP